MTVGALSGKRAASYQRVRDNALHPGRPEGLPWMEEVARVGAFYARAFPAFENRHSQRGTPRALEDASWRGGNADFHAGGYAGDGEGDHAGAYQGDRGTDYFGEYLS